jgi:hypothetical protein
MDPFGLAHEPPGSAYVTAEFFQTIVFPGFFLSAAGAAPIAAGVRGRPSTPLGAAVSCLITTNQGLP